MSFWSNSQRFWKNTCLTYSNWESSRKETNTVLEIFTPKNIQKKFWDDTFYKKKS